MPREGFEPTISAGERPKTYALDRAATGTGSVTTSYFLISLAILHYVFLVCFRTTNYEKRATQLTFLTNKIISHLHKYLYVLVHKPAQHLIHYMGNISLFKYNSCKSLLCMCLAAQVVPY